MNVDYEKTAVDKAQEYYNSTPADQFYFNMIDIAKQALKVKKDMDK